MKIRSCSYNIFFPAFKNLRELFFEFEKELTDFMSPFELLPIPNDAPVEIPRIRAFSKSGHSSLLMTAQNAVITVNFDAEYWDNIDKCFNYIENKKNSLIAAYDSILLPKSRMNIFFSGLTSQIEFDESDIGTDPVSFINNNFVKIKSKQQLEDIFIKFTHIFNESFYINMEIQNIRFFSGTQFGSLMSVAGMRQQSHTIYVNLDVNDRYSYNLHPGYVTDKDKIKRIFTLSKRVVSRKLRNIVMEGGDLDYDN